MQLDKPCLLKLKLSQIKFSLQAEIEIEIVPKKISTQAENLEAKDANGFSDPYCMLGIRPKMVEVVMIVMMMTVVLMVMMMTVVIIVMMVMMGIMVMVVVMTVVLMVMMGMVVMMLAVVLMVMMMMMTVVVEM